MTRRKTSKQRATDDDRAVGARLRELRLLFGYSQARVGEVLGVSFQAVQKYESGENRIVAGKLVAAASLFGVPVSTFFTGNTAPDDARGISSEALFLAGRIDRLPRPQRDVVRNLVNSLAAEAT